MADIKAITLPNGATYNLRDTSALPASEAIPVATITAMWNGTYTSQTNEQPENPEILGGE